MWVSSKRRAITNTTAIFDSLTTIETKPFKIWEKSQYMTYITAFLSETRNSYQYNMHKDEENP